MKQFIVILTLCMGILQSAHAQTFTQRIQKKVQGQGTLTIHQDEAIDALVNTPTAPAKPATKPSTPQQQASGSKPATPTRPAEQAGKKQGEQPAASQQEEEEGADAGKKVMRNGHKVMGYRVQAYAGGSSRKDRQKAEQMGHSIKAQYPNVPVYVHFYSPRWICRVGNYRTYEEAHQMLLNIRKLGCTEASVVKDRIIVPY